MGSGFPEASQVSVMSEEAVIDSGWAVISGGFLTAGETHTHTQTDCASRKAPSAYSAASLTYSCWNTNHLQLIKY